MRGPSNSGMGTKATAAVDSGMDARLARRTLPEDKQEGSEAVRQQKGDLLLATVQSEVGVSTGSASQPRGGAGPCCSSGGEQSLVPTVCHHGRLLKSLIHLPVSSFEGSGDVPSGGGHSGCNSRPASAEQFRWC